jgi:hypothetical protein
MARPETNQNVCFICIHGNYAWHPGGPYPYHRNPGEMGLRTPQSPSSVPLFYLR